MIVFSTPRSFLYVIIGLFLMETSTAFTTAGPFQYLTVVFDEDDQDRFLGERCEHSTQCERGVINSWCSRNTKQSSHGICSCEAGFKEEGDECIRQPFYAYSIVLEMFAGLFGCLLLLGALGYCFKKMRKAGQRDMRHGYIPYSPRDQENLHRAAMLVQQINNQSVVVALARNYGTTREERIARGSLDADGNIIINPLEATRDLANTKVIFRPKDQTLILPPQTDLTCPSDDSGLAPSPNCPPDTPLHFGDDPPPYVEIIHRNEIVAEVNLPNYDQVVQMTTHQSHTVTTPKSSQARAKRKRKIK